MRNILHVPVVAAVLILFTKVGAAQINMQPTSGSTLEHPSSIGTSRNSVEASITASNSPLRVVPEDFARLKLASGFLVSLRVLDDPDFSGEFRINEQGDITVPELGVLHVAGETSSEAREQIVKELLKGQFLKDPLVTLTVLEYTAPQVTIIGEVHSPGKYPLLAPRRLVEVLALAGGPTDMAGDEVLITPARDGNKSLIVHFSRASNPQTVSEVIVDPGDTVQVKRAGIVYVLGAVNRPGGYVMQEDGTLNVLQAISLANGTSISASTKTIYLLHRNSDGTDVDIALPYEKISHGKRADVRLHAKDVLFVPTSRIKSTFINGQSILATAASASIYAGVIY